MTKTLDKLNSPELVNMTDQDTYSRQLGSKALIMTNPKEADEYDAKRAAALVQRNAVAALASKVDSLEVKFDKVLDILGRLEGKLNHEH